MAGSAVTNRGPAGRLGKRWRAREHNGRLAEMIVSRTEKKQAGY
jgi:hypothetical protein